MSKYSVGSCSPQSRSEMSGFWRSKDLMCIKRNVWRTTESYSFGNFNNQFSESEWLHVSTEGSLLDIYYGAGAGIFYELLSFYLPQNITTTVFDGEIEAIAVVVERRSLSSSAFKAVIYSDS
ncbi:uncharacterized protein TNCV_1041921 [Trichonephila clavipes]|nr:uncharacterized protein TNCV_1041921 [Trichonephila clavipes]